MPNDFIFRLTLGEGKAVMLSRSQIATLKRGQNIKCRPYVFTEHAAVMLLSSQYCDSGRWKLRISR